MSDRPTVSPFDLRPRTQRGRDRLPRVQWDITAAIALGGALGSLGRYALGSSWPTPNIGFPWATFVINVGGCLLIGVVMVLIIEVGSAHRLLRPFLGVGVLGGFTTFSTYAVETQRLLESRQTLLALGYLLGTLVAAMLAVQLGIVATRVFARHRIRRGG